MFKNMKIGTQIVVVAFVLVALGITCTSVTSIRYFKRYIERLAAEDVTLSLEGFRSFIDEQMDKTRNFRDMLIGNMNLGRLTTANDAEGIVREMGPMIKNMDIDILTIIDMDGKVIARAHDPKKYGDTVDTSGSIRMAMSGKTYEEITAAPSSRLGYYCGGPITYMGEIVGTFRTAISFENVEIVDDVKKMFGDEVTIFADKTRINTTFQESGKRMIDTDASQAVVNAVLKEGKSYIGETTIFNDPYLATYAPLRDANGTIKGMLFTGKSLVAMRGMIKSMITAILLVSLVVLAIAFALSLFVARRISKPLGQIVRLSERSVEGDLTITREDFKYDGGGELGVLVDSISGMISAQVEALSRVISTADEVMEHTGSLGRIAGENATATAKTEGLIEEVTELCKGNSAAVDRGAASVSEMASGANSVAQMSVDSADSLARTTNISTKAVDSVNGLADDIGIVDSKTLENQTKIKDLSSSVSEISNFMGVIASIADQTNLLALNAAIEAARAGEAGRGFAVVAEEVRKLAEESRNASNSVEKLVSKLSSNAQEAIDATEESVKIVREIRTKASVTVDALNGALGEITKANDAIQSIAAVAEEQAAGSSEISEAIDEIKRSTNLITEKMGDLNMLSAQTASIGSSVSTSAVEMSSSTEEMKNVLSHFKMDKETRPALKARN